MFSDRLLRSYGTMGKAGRREEREKLEGGELASKVRSDVQWYGEIT